MEPSRGMLSLLVLYSILLAQALAQSTTSPTGTDAAQPSGVGTSQRPAPAFTYKPIGRGGSMTANPVLPPAGGKVVVGATCELSLQRR
ncbi:hypothetical protein M427DRAFT_388337 [Gonapodya prolifera JEL478]|uniref:Uncharacterized protein n=1 Tax=Gonapodya prolifera (strain JEL478) TaxID=1344416 RepID=A0A139A8H3_GONPJ|nr:hypothetical protein M427DRAFT_388337 [Gonapodya prolifera JEL478]|eukprot:KXS13004.1 hypothetical protein M427DRAFT_388337 [Gonapodya prolifera JEL478]